MKRVLMRRFLLLFALILTGCTGASAPKITAQQVFDRLQRSGLATNARTVPSPVADSSFAPCADRLGFDIPGTGFLGIINICPKSTADTIMARPTATTDTRPMPINIEAYRYRSNGGTVIVAIERTCPQDTAARIGREVQIIPE